MRFSPLVCICAGRPSCHTSISFHLISSSSLLLNPLKITFLERNWRQSNQVQRKFGLSTGLSAGKMSEMINNKSFIESLCFSSLSGTKNRPWRIGVLGLTNKKERPSYYVSEYMQNLGYKIIPINPKSTEILNEKCFKSLAQIANEEHSDSTIDVLQVFRAPKHALSIVKEALKLRNELQLKAIWFQEGTIEEDVIEYISQNEKTFGDLNFVMNKCTKKECMRFKRFSSL